MLRRRLWLYANVSSNSLVLDDQVRAALSSIRAPTLRDGAPSRGPVARPLIHTRLLRACSAFLPSPQRFENIRLALEHCSPDEDIQLFLHEKQTGRERPGEPLSRAKGRELGREHNAKRTPMSPPVLPLTFRAQRPSSTANFMQRRARRPTTPAPPRPPQVRRLPPPRPRPKVRCCDESRAPAFFFRLARFLKAFFSDTQR